MAAVRAIRAVMDQYRASGGTVPLDLWNGQQIDWRGFATKNGVTDAELAVVTAAELKYNVGVPDPNRPGFQRLEILLTCANEQRLIRLYPGACDAKQCMRAKIQQHTYGIHTHAQLHGAAYMCKRAGAKVIRQPMQFELLPGGQSSNWPGSLGDGVAAPRTLATLDVMGVKDPPADHVERDENKYADAGALAKTKRKIELPDKKKSRELHQKQDRGRVGIDGDSQQERGGKEDIE